MLPVALATTINCGSGGGENGPGAGGSAGSSSTGRGGSVGTAGTTGSGGASGSAGAGGGSGFPACTPVIVPVTDANVLDFTGTSGAQATFMYGGTFIYPDAGLQPDLMGISSDVTGSWHVTGLVRNYSGFGLYLSCKLDLSAFSGLQFDIKGTFAGNGMGDGGAPAASVTLNVGDAPTDVDSAHNASPPSWGTCVPATGNQYDGTC